MTWVAKSRDDVEMRAGKRIAGAVILPVDPYGCWPSTLSLPIKRADEPRSAIS